MAPWFAWLDISKLKMPESETPDSTVKQERQIRAAETPDSGAGTPRIGGAQPAPNRHPTATRTDQLTASQETGGRQPGDATIEKSALSIKQEWQNFIQKAQAFNLDDVMVYAMPKPEEMEAVLKQLELLGGDIELLADDIDDWVGMQSPPLSTLQYGRWTRWLEQSTGHIAKLAEFASKRKQLTRG